MNKKILAFVADLPVLHQRRGNRPEDRAVNLMVGQKFNCKATQTDLSASECAGKIRIKLLPSKFFMSHCFPVFKGFKAFPPSSDQERISPYNINTISSIVVMRIKENIN